MSTDFTWASECDYISKVTDVARGLRTPDEAFNLSNFNYDRSAFIRYCIMQRNAAERQGHSDSATYIQHCIDDLQEE